MFENIPKLVDNTLRALAQTGYMVVISLAVSIVLGGLLGLLIYLTSEELFLRNRVINNIMNVAVNIIRSIPFLILMIFLLPLSKLIVGTKIGPDAVIVPLSICNTAFFARLAEASFSEVDRGVIEAFVASGAPKVSVITKILFPEAFPSFVKNITVTALSVLGYSAMAGLVGGGGLGDLAYRYGYQQYKTDVLLVCIILLIVLVQLIQYTGDGIVSRINKKR